MLTLLFTETDAAKWVTVIDAVLVLAAAVVAMTPTDKDDTVVDRLRNVFRALKLSK